MKKLWGYIAVFLLGVITGMITMFQLAKKSISSTTIKGKVKQRRTHDSIQDVTNTITKTDAKADKKIERKAKQEERKIKRAMKKAQK